MSCRLDSIPEYRAPPPASNECRYCGSPSRHNPCWWWLDHPEMLLQGGDAPWDPPCFELDDNERWLAQSRTRKRIFRAVMLSVVVGLGLLLWLK